MPSAKAKIARHLGKQPEKAKEITKRRVRRWLEEELRDIAYNHRTGENEG